MRAANKSAMYTILRYIGLEFTLYAFVPDDVL